MKSHSRTLNSSTAQDPASASGAPGFRDPQDPGPSPLFAGIACVPQVLQSLMEKLLSVRRKICKAKIRGLEQEVKTSAGFKSLWKQLSYHTLVAWTSVKAGTFFTIVVCTTIWRFFRSQAFGRALRTAPNRSLSARKFEAA
jgi:hypothetical protein